MSAIDLDILGMGAANPVPRTPLRQDAETASQNLRLAAMQSSATLTPVTVVEVADQNLNAAAQAVAVQVGYVGTMSVGALEDEIRFYQRRTVEAILETGKRLLVLKELTPHGEFEQRVELLGFSTRSARRFMQAAAKTAKSAILADLSKQTKNGLAFLELVTHDDDVLEDLSHLDNIDRMSASELRARVRQLETKGSQEAEEERQRANRIEVQLETANGLNEMLRAAQASNPQYPHETNVVRQRSALLDEHCAGALDALGDMAAELEGQAGVLAEGEFRARFHSLWFAAQAAQARTVLLVQRLHDMGEGFVPESVDDFKAGLLSADEANYLLAEVGVLRTALADRQTALKQGLDAVLPRKPGRPKGAKSNPTKGA